MLHRKLLWQPQHIDLLENLWILHPRDHQVCPNTKSAYFFTSWMLNGFECVCECEQHGLWWSAHFKKKGCNTSPTDTLTKMMMQNNRYLRKALRELNRQINYFLKRGSFPNSLAFYDETKYNTSSLNDCHKLLLLANAENGWQFWFQTYQSHGEA